MKNTYEAISERKFPSNAGCSRGGESAGARPARARQPTTAARCALTSLLTYATGDRPARAAVAADRRERLDPTSACARPPRGSVVRETGKESFVFQSLNCEYTHCKP